MHTYAQREQPLFIHRSRVVSGKSIEITGSKSETNRYLILSALYKNIQIKNASDSEDTQVLERALKQDLNIIDIHHAGTAMRFLTAYYSFCADDKEVILTGSSRMKERPISVLVDALRVLGAKIEYLEKEGFPPLKIKSTRPCSNIVSVDAGVSSQYLSALFLIAPSFKDGLQIRVSGNITSISYLNMTISILEKIGVLVSKEDNIFKVKPFANQGKTIKCVVESDWSSASYYYALIALSPVSTEITLSSYSSNSFQGDSKLSDIYTFFGVSTEFYGRSIRLKKETTHRGAFFSEDLKSTPDIAQTIAVTCFALGIGCHLTGLSTLKIKETDRLIALKTELKKFGASVSVTDSSITLNPFLGEITSGVIVSTYNDHRMAMAFAPLCLKTDIAFECPSVVEKSYPDFWKDWFSVLERLT